MKKILNIIFNTLVIVMTYGMVTFAAEYTVTEMNDILYTTDNVFVYLDADVNMKSECVLPKDMQIPVTGVTSNGFWRININNNTFYLIGNALGTKNVQTNVVVEEKNDKAIEELYLGCAIDSVSALRKNLKNPKSLVLDSCYGGSLIYDNKNWYIVNIGYYATNSFGGYTSDTFTVVYNLSDNTVAYGLKAVINNIDFYFALQQYFTESSNENYYLQNVKRYDVKSIGAFLGV